MSRFGLCLTVCLFWAISHPVDAQTPKSAPKTTPPVVGTWELKSVTIDEKNVPAEAKELAALLKTGGGVEIGMVYKIRRDRTIMMGKFKSNYGYSAEEKELGVEWSNEKGQDDDLMFEVKFEKKNMILTFRHKEQEAEKTKKVEMTFAPAK